MQELKPEDVKRLKLSFSKQFHLAKELKNTDLMSMVDAPLGIVTKPTRTISGVAPVAIMTGPRTCTHGKCTFCPGGPDSFFGDMAQSYTGNEPASMRAKRNFFDPYLQVMNRLEHYMLLNQVPQKVELIIMGGTFLSYPDEYQRAFVHGSLQAMNDFSQIFFPRGVFNKKRFTSFFHLPSEVKNPERVTFIQSALRELRQKRKTSLEEEQELNENAYIRCTAMVIETKPDWCFEKDIDKALSLGATRVEVGCQTVFDRVLKLTNRGHTIQDTVKATALLKDSLLKVTYHMMLGLPGSTVEMDTESFREIIHNPDFRPDSLKIYPCRVFPGTPLYEQWKKGFFQPMTTEEAVEILTSIKPQIPRWMRVMRIQRDIPSHLSVAGPEKTNLRQMVGERMERDGMKCACIRCREPRNKKISWRNIRLHEIRYEASHGTEIFISADDIQQDILVGFCRLRIPPEPFRAEIKDAAGIRELHVYGKQLGLHEQQEGALQHKGIGKKLMESAERIAREEYGKKKMVVISGIGVREYYQKYLGYSREGPYMVK